MRIILLICLTLNLLHAQKIALLIGNDDYSFAPLSNPLNDVDGIYQTLQEIGFDISSKDVLKNASKIEIETALANFSQRASSAEIALIYFSGHGMQVNNTNYMLPAKTNPKKPVDLFGLVNLDYFIQSATSAKYGIVLVDACRDNPLVKYFQNGKHKGVSAKKGLGQVTPTAGQVVIGFATSAGDTADDGNGDMSPYAKALAHRLKEPNKDITKVLGLVALDVSAKHNQNPIIRTNLAYDVLLNRNDKVLKQSKFKVKIVEKIDSKPIKTNKNIVTIDGLKYQNQLFNKRYNWGEAKKYCKNLDLAGLTNWRLPTFPELKKIIINKPMLVGKDNDKVYIKKEFIKNLPSNSGWYWFWSSTSKNSISAKGLETHGSLEYSGFFEKKYKRFVMCVSE